MYTYQIFAADNHSNSRVEAARKSFFMENIACYVISKDGQMQMIQFEGAEPYRGETLELSAELHIAALEAQASQAEQVTE